jgi:peroxiredoxin
LAELRTLLKPGEAARLLAVSVDDAATSKTFASKIAADGRGAIEFSILSDPKHETIDAYGLHDAAYDGEEFEGIPHPAVYVIGKDRRVAWAVVEEDYRKRPKNSDIRAALEALKQ